MFVTVNVSAAVTAAAPKRCQRGVATTRGAKCSTESAKVIVVVAVTTWPTLSRAVATSVCAHGLIGSTEYTDSPADTHPDRVIGVYVSGSTWPCHVTTC